MTALELHTSDLKKAQTALALAIKQHGANSQEFWAVKDKKKKYEIAWSQSFNNAIDACSGKMITQMPMTLEQWHLYFYEYLTSPYRPTKRAGKEGVANIDSEINDEDLPQNET